MPWRLSIRQLMAFTAIFAINFGIVVAASRVYDLIVAVYACGPMLVCVQIALYRVFVGRQTRRPFWLGFATAGTAAASLTYVLLFHHVPAQQALFAAYAYVWGAIAKIAPSFERTIASNETLGIAVLAFHFFVPQAALALAGGFLANRLARRSATIGESRRT
jgi:hypothetical protein